MRILLKPALATLVIAAVVPAQASGSPGVQAFAWMTGSWGSQQDGTWVEEHWLAPRGGLMLGTNRTGDKDRAKDFEFLRIAVGPDGIPVYWAAPGGGPAIPFRMVAFAPSTVTFQNLDNPYPKRIRYRRSGDILEATIEGGKGDQPQSWIWHRLARPDEL